VPSRSDVDRRFRDKSFTHEKYREDGPIGPREPEPVLPTLKELMSKHPVCPDCGRRWWPVGAADFLSCSWCGTTKYFEGVGEDDSN
jgi:tRNA(Ile2) C34 agmatinyltransferase TiaS